MSRFRGLSQIKPFEQHERRIKWSLKLAEMQSDLDNAENLTLCYANYSLREKKFPAYRFLGDVDATPWKTREEHKTFHTTKMFIMSIPEDFI